jgi:hypothetical protein
MGQPFRHVIELLLGLPALYFRFILFNLFYLAQGALPDQTVRKDQH